MARGTAGTPASLRVEGRSASRLRARLLRWYRLHARAFPGRVPPAQSATRRPDAYHVLLSETMLQQTQVATVLPYFERFVREFPTLRALANADEQRVLRLWQGLGYYRRARNLHACAKTIVAEQGGRVPEDLHALLALPGVGRYTAGAVASIAFGVRAAVVDGNVARVLARVLAIEQPIDAPATREALWRAAGALVPARSPGDFNQAVMELGATVCTPRSPRCDACPISALCGAHRDGRVDELPITRGRRRPKAVEHHAVALRDPRGRYLFEQRPGTGLWSSMWQMPTHEGAATAHALGAWVAERLKRPGGERPGAVVRLESVGMFTHQTTHRTIAFTLWRGDVEVTRSKRRRGQAWRGLDELDDLPLPNPQRRAVEMLRAGDGDAGER